MTNKEKFDKVKSVLYERCNNGEISVEERERYIAIATEDLITKPAKEALALEKAEEESKLEELNAIFEKASDKVYSAWVNDEITVEERDAMIEKVKEKIFGKVEE